MRHDGRVKTTFPMAPHGQLGYDVTEVESFLEKARAAYSGAAPTRATGTTAIDSERIRRTAFSMTKGGYATAHVDAALERLEDAFADRERQRSLSGEGDAAWFAGARTAAEEIVARLDRSDGHRFDRVGFLTQGYHPEDVDRFAKRLSGYFGEGQALSIDDVRAVVFRSRRGGYREAQVDVVLDAVVDVMLAVR